MDGNEKIPTVLTVFPIGVRKDVNINFLRTGDQFDPQVHRFCVVDDFFFEGVEDGPRLSQTRRFENVAASAVL